MKVDRLSLHLGRRKEKAANQSKNEETEQEITKRKEEKVIRSICSFQKRVGPPEYRKWRRIHGLQLPLHPQQIGGWIILLTIGAATFFVMIPALQSFFRNILFIILGTLFILHIVSHLTALLLDPADPELRAQKANFTVPEFDRTKHAHVIENGRCHLCNIKTSSSKTKHCSVCNKCIDHFDHHCKWLNHCIGGRNYVPFLICVISAVAASFVVVGVSVLEIVYYHVKPELLTLLPASQNGTTEMLFLPDSVFLSVIIVLGLLAATTAGLLLHLCLFHCYISFLGISTYEYIRNYRQEGGSEAERRLIGYNCCKKNNEVMTNRLDTRQKTPNSWTKFTNWCYYSCSRPPEGHDFEENQCCSRANYFLFRTRFCFKQSKKHKRKILKRQSTDPEFVDKIIKPFLITLNEEKNIEATSSRTKPCYNTMNEHKQNNCTCRVKEEESLNQKQSDEQDKLHIRRFRHSLSWVKIILSRSSTEDSNTTSKLKTNQICPTNAEEQPDNGTEIKKKQEDCPPLVHHTIDITSLPELTESNKSMQDRVDLKELSDVLDMVDGPESKFVLTMKSIYRKTRRKNFVGIPKSPPLSPIRESGLSNPGSPRVDLVLPPTPVFVRPNSPETSFIFLSNPSSLSSSSDDDNEIVTYPGPVINRHYRSEDILQTPQLPRKAYPNNKVDEIFVLPKSRNTKWINVELVYSMKDEFWTKTLRSPHLVVAPMVDASELAWRLLSRRHGAQLCYTPMLHSLIFSSNERYRREGLASVPEDRPLIVQFCGNDADSMLKAALLAQPYCDAIDINLGCPQAIAKRGRYGAFLQDDWPLLTKIVSTLNEYLSIPVTCKIRVYEDIRQTVEYAKMLESAGCHMLTVHGRTKEQKGPLTGLASWEHIKAVKESVSIPVLANGNIQCLQDVYRCMEVTNCDGVMSAEGNLYNPAIFESRYPPAWEMALEYLDLVEEHPCPLSYVRGHLFKIFHHILCLPDNKDVRTELANKSTIEDFRNVARTIQQRFEPFHNGSEVWINGYCDNYDLVLPPWVCKPYERPSPEEHLKKLIELQNKAKEERKDMKDGLVGETSAKRPREEIITVKDRSAKKKYKKLTKFAEKANAVRRIVVICSAEVSCPNPMGLKCEFKLCKTCCRGKCYEENADCPGHGILIKTRRERAKLFSENKKPSQPEDDFRESQITDEILIKVV